MRNHFHLVVETPRANLVTGMQWLLGTYTVRFNRRHNLTGHLFGGRYKSVIVDGSGNGYFKTVCDYVHLNPVRAGLIGPSQPLDAYRWSSYRDYLKSPRRRPEWMRVDRLLGEARIFADTFSSRKEFRLMMERRRSETIGADWQPLRRGWWVGSTEFRNRLLGDASELSTRLLPSSDRRESEIEKAERIVVNCLARLGWCQAELNRRRKGDPDKVRIARQVRSETMVTLHWIAGRLGMGTAPYVAYRLRRESNR
jgi:hypothetical protein